MGVAGDDNLSLKLYIRLPDPIKEEQQIKDLHPDITSVYLPRQSSCRWCFAYFESQEKLSKALLELRQIKIEDKPVRAYLPRIITPEKIEKRRARRRAKKLERKLAKKNQANESTEAEASGDSVEQKSSEETLVNPSETSENLVQSLD